MPPKQKPFAEDALQERLRAAIQLQQQGLLDGAEAIYRELLRTHPRHPLVLQMLGVLAAQQQRPATALELLQQAVALAPQDPAAHNNLGKVLFALHRYDEALAAYDHAIALQPRNAVAHYNRGTIALQQRRYAEAVADLEQARVLQPGVAGHYSNLGLAYVGLRRSPAALEAFGHCLALDPHHHDGLVNRSSLLVKLGRTEEALADLVRARALRPDTPYLQGLVLHLRMQLCDWDGWAVRRAALLDAIGRGEPAAQPFDLVALPCSPAQQLRCAKNYAQEKTQALQPAPPLPFPHRAAPDRRRIRIGYYSADFHGHATAYLMAGLIELHDRGRFEIVAYSFGPPGVCAMRDRMERAFDRFVEIGHLTDAQAVALARQDGIDIAVDLKGYTDDGRIGIFLQRAAPVQVAYLGYPGTAGTDCIDYLIADERVVPHTHCAFYAEKLAWLPDSYQVNDRHRRIAHRTPPRAELGLPDDAFVFCCFNASYKVTPDVFDVWMRLLQRVPGSVLWLFHDKDAAVANLRQEAARRGVPADRLVFARKLELADHLARCRQADLFIDTFHCNAHTTASDALWAGVPVLTLQGQTFAARVASSLLHAVGLPELVTTTPSAYEALAVRMATDPALLASLRQRLQEYRMDAPLFDTARFARHLEQAYQQIWERHLQGLPPANLRVSPVANTTEATKPVTAR
ncbi:tetratricopeptide repeat protein [Sphingomonas sp. NCPPB 2930]